MHMFLIGRAGQGRQGRGRLAASEGRMTHMAQVQGE